MVNIWYVRPGIDANLWDNFRENNYIAIGWENETGYYNYKSLQDVKNEGYGRNDASSIWDFYKTINIGDVVIAIKGLNSGKNAVLGIGIVKSDYIGPKDKENPGIKYKNIRDVDWLITEEMNTISYNFAQKTINFLKDPNQFKEIRDGYIKKNPSYYEIFQNIQTEGNLNETTKSQDELSMSFELNEILSQTKNIILYGPPGTGKTYTVQQFIKTFLAGQLSKPKSFDDIKMEYLQDLTWYQITALSMYLIGKEKKIKVADLKSNEFIIFYSDRIKEREKGLSQSLWATLQIHSNPDSNNVKYERRSSPILFDKTENSEWYLLPDGIEYVETNLSEIVDALSSKKEVSEEKSIEQFCTFVTFHQSYGYEDFIEGLKPVVNDNGDVSYKVEAGVFKEISERARHDPENNYVLVIDEINRGNIAKIFGELITLIEDDKRSEANKKGLSVKLPYSKTEFSVPSNLYILGTMNTADRSIALLDIALRRRFTFLEIMPDYSIIEFNVGGVNIDSLLEGLNITVSALIDRDHQIGHSYFCDLADLEEDLAKDKLYFIWYKKIIPLLQEYFYNDWEQLKLILGDFVVENGTHRVPALKDKIVNKSYEIRDFEGDWDAFSRALNKIYAGEQDFTVDKDILSSENVDLL